MRICHLCLTFYLVYRPVHSYSNRDLNQAVWAQFLSKDFQHWKHLKRGKMLSEIAIIWEKEKNDQDKSVDKSWELSPQSSQDLQPIEDSWDNPTLFPKRHLGSRVLGSFMLLDFYHACQLSNNWRLALSLLAKNTFLITANKITFVPKIPLLDSPTFRHANVLNQAKIKQTSSSKNSLTGDQKTHWFCLQTSLKQAPCVCPRGCHERPDNKNTNNQTQGSH